MVKTAKDIGALTVRLTQQAPIPLDVKFHCEPGELLALTGPSGSGKTSILRAIAGLNKVQSGQVHCNGQIWQDAQQGIFLAPQHRRTGLVFQHYALFPHLNVIKNITTAMSHIPRALRRDKAMEWLALTNMDGLENQKPTTLSGGQRQRVALARALAREPEVLLLDEPFSAVDQLTRNKLYRELAKIRTALEMPMILVTHDMSEVQQLADSICLIHHGSSLQTGTINSVMRKPNSATIARLIGHQNLLSGTFNRSTNTVSVLGITIPVAPVDLPSGQVDVLIEPSAIIMHRKDKPSMGERENPLSTTVSEAIELGDELSVKLSEAQTNGQLVFRISRHVANRNKVAVGEPLTVSLMQDGIHLMRTTSQQDRS